MTLPPDLDRICLILGIYINTGISLRMMEYTMSMTDCAGSTARERIQDRAGSVVCSQASTGVTHCIHTTRGKARKATA